MRPGIGPMSQEKGERRQPGPATFAAWVHVCGHGRWWWCWSLVLHVPHTQTRTCTGKLVEKQWPRSQGKKAGRKEGNRRQHHPHLNHLLLTQTTTKKNTECFAASGVRHTLVPISHHTPSPSHQSSPIHSHTFTHCTRYTKTATKR